MNGIICKECGGSGCPVCNNSGYAKSHHSDTVFDLRKHQEVWADKPIVPMPYGKILPDLTDCCYPNEGLSEPGDDDYDEILDEKFLCPNCGSDNVVGLSSKYNPDCSVMGENRTPSGRWFCISCHDSWCYEREH